MEIRSNPFMRTHAIENEAERDRCNLFLRIQCLRMVLRERHQSTLLANGVYDVKPSSVWDDFQKRANADDSFEDLSTLHTELSEMLSKPLVRPSDLNSWDVEVLELLRNLPKSDWAENHFSKQIISPPPAATNLMDLVQDIIYLRLMFQLWAWRNEAERATPFPRGPAASLIQHWEKEINVMTPPDQLQTTRLEIWKMVRNTDLKNLKQSVENSKTTEEAAATLVGRYSKSTYGQNFLLILVNHCPEMVETFCKIVNDLYPVCNMWSKEVTQPLVSESGETSPQYTQGLMIVNTAVHIFMHMAQKTAPHVAKQLTELFFVTYNQLVLLPFEQCAISLMKCIPECTPEMQNIPIFGPDGLFPPSVLTKPRFLNMDHLLDAEKA